jgi:hypothetical protein
MLGPQLQTIGQETYTDFLLLLVREGRHVLTPLHLEYAPLFKSRSTYSCVKQG